MKLLSQHKLFVSLKQHVISSIANSYMLKKKFTVE